MHRDDTGDRIICHMLCCSNLTDKVQNCSSTKQIFDLASNSIKRLSQTRQRYTDRPIYGSYQYQQESCAIAKITARCALYKQA